MSLEKAKNTVNSLELELIQLKSDKINLQKEINFMTQFESNIKLNQNPLKRTSSVLGKNMFDVLADLPQNDNIEVYKKTNNSDKGMIKRNLRRTQSKNSNVFQPNKNHLHSEKSQEKNFKHKTTFSKPICVDDTNRLNKSSMKLIIVGDSHVRELAALLQPLVKDYIVSSYCYSGAPLLSIVENINNIQSTLSNKDYIVLHGGTNNTEEKHFHQAMVRLQNIIKFSKANFILTEMPSLNTYKGQEAAIQTANYMLKFTADDLMIPYLIFSHTLQKRHFSGNGHHLNRAGKKIVSSKIAAWFLGVVKENCFANTEFTEKQCKIEIEEANIEAVFKKFQTRKDTAFVHCISADLEDNNSMSAGVALKFKNAFGKPKTSDCLNNYLTYQEVQEGSSVYGLITKRKYHGKPEPSCYDAAFTNLIQDFKKRDLKQLICSPLGCVRDNISLNKFATNIVEFHHRTKASVSIICYDEQSFRGVLPYPAFVRFLRNAIDVQLSSTEECEECLGRCDASEMMAPPTSTRRTRGPLTSSPPLRATRQTTEKSPDFGSTLTIPSSPASLHKPPSQPTSPMMEQTTQQFTNSYSDVIKSSPLRLKQSSDLTDTSVIVLDLN
jgi:hypothetical protein